VLRAGVVLKREDRPAPVHVLRPLPR